MKKVFSMFLAVCIILALVSCTKDGTQSQPPTVTQEQVQSTIPNKTPSPTQSPSKTPIEADLQETATPDVPESFEGKIAIITFYPLNDGHWYTALPVIDKYGEDKVIHVTWPTNFMDEHEQMINIVAKLSDDRDIKAIIVNPAVLGTNSVFEKLRETRKDIFVVYCDADLWEETASPTKTQTAADLTQTADLILKTDELGMGSAMVRQAQKLGAKTFVHYSAQTAMSWYPILSERRALIKQECEKRGIKFIDATDADPKGEIGVAGAQQFILEDVPKMVEKYGKDTVFFHADSTVWSSLIKAVIETGAVYTHPLCFLTPASGFPSALGIEYPEDSNDFKRVYKETKEILTEKGMLSRLSTWPVWDDYMYTFVGAEYAIKWINGEVPKECVDVDVLKQLMKDYAGVEVYLTPYTDEFYTDMSYDVYEGTGETYDNFLMMRMDYLTFE